MIKWLLRKHDKKLLQLHLDVFKVRLRRELRKYRKQEWMDDEMFILQTVIKIKRTLKDYIEE